MRQDDAGPQADRGDPAGYFDLKRATDRAKHQNSELVLASLKPSWA